MKTWHWFIIGALLYFFLTKKSAIAKAEQDNNELILDSVGALHTFDLPNV